MVSKNIYLLFNKASAKQNYVNRYIKFIAWCNNISSDDTYLEIHHILPKSLYPEFSDLNIFEWNGIKLTARQHFIAHYILSKCFIINSHECKSMLHAFMCMRRSNSLQHRYYNSKLYENAKKHFSNNMSNFMSMAENNPYTQTTVKNKIIELYGGLGNASDQIFNKQKQTMLERHGVDNYFKHKSFIEDNASKTSKRWNDPNYKLKTRKAISEARNKQNCSGTNNSFYGMNHTDETKQLISNKKKGIPRNKCCCIMCKTIVSDNNIGKHICQEPRPILVTCPHCNKTAKRGSNMDRWHFNNCKIKIAT